MFGLVFLLLLLFVLGGCLVYISVFLFSFVCCTFHLLLRSVNFRPGSIVVHLSLPLATIPILIFHIILVEEPLLLHFWVWLSFLEHSPGSPWLSVMRIICWEGWSEEFLVCVHIFKRW